MMLSDLLRAADESVGELTQLHQDLVRFPTVNTGVMPTGHETPCARWLADLLDYDGVRAEVWEAAPHRGNLLARLPGRGEGRSLLWMSHLDVVPEGDASRWSRAPFGGELVDGWVYGRGSNDCKGLVSPQVHALRLLARHRVPLRGDLRLAACADEEAGGTYGFAAVAAQRPEALQADLAINEGGGASVRLRDGRPAVLVAVGEKGRLEAQFTLRGHSEHASMPWLADNPLDTLANLLRRLRQHRAQVVLTPPAEELLRSCLGSLPPHGTDLDEWLKQHAADLAGDLPRLLALTRMTIEPTVVNAGQKSNAVPDQATLTVDIRTLPQQTRADVERELRRITRGLKGVGFRLTETAVANDTAWTAAWAELCSEVLAAAGTPDCPALPTWCTGFTDSRLVRPLGVPVLGFAPVPPDTDGSRCGCHNIDEQFPVAALLYRTKVLLALAWRWCG
ncbi:MAG: M20/M25/M40 family metallo-hydrolase [Fimbriimonadaceae bacterium]|nr:M20/M25/M40 family metallo-hydrolase [Fimbriimonadaceae bacterium]